MDTNIANKISNLVGNICVGYKGSSPDYTPASAKADLKKFLESLEVPVSSEMVKPSENNGMSDSEISNLVDSKLKALENELNKIIETRHSERMAKINDLNNHVLGRDKLVDSHFDKLDEISKNINESVVDLKKAVSDILDKSEIERMIHEAVESQLKNFIPTKPEVLVKVYRGVEYSDDGKEIIATYSRAKVPVIKHVGDSGADAYVCFDDNTKPETYVGVAPGTVVQVPLGISCDIPEGYEIQLRPRSGASQDGHCAILGTIDSRYRGVLKVNIANISTEPLMINEGDRLGQLVLKPIENVKYEMVDGTIDTNTERGTKGFGSSGKRD